MLPIRVVSACCACKKAESEGGDRRAGSGRARHPGSIRLIITADAVLYPRDQANIVPKISAPVRAFPGESRRSREAGTTAGRARERRSRGRGAESRGQYEQAESNFRATTAAGVPEQLKKAQTDVDAARRRWMRRRSSSTVASSCSRTARCAQEAGRRGARSRYAQAKGRVRHRPAAPAGAAERRRQGTDQDRRGAGRGGERTLRQRRRRRPATRKSAVRSPASSPIGRSTRARWPPPARRC